MDLKFPAGEAWIRSLKVETKLSSDYPDAAPEENGIAGKIELAP
jgi:hypothetical protein